MSSPETRVCKGCVGVLPLIARRRLSLDWPCSCAACPRSPSWPSSAALTRRSWTTQGVFAVVACLLTPAITPEDCLPSGTFPFVQGPQEVWDAVRRVPTRVLLVGRCVLCAPIPLSITPRGMHAFNDKVREGHTLLTKRAACVAVDPTLACAWY